MYGELKKPRGIRVEESTWKRMKKAAKGQRIPIAEAVRRALVMWLDAVEG